MRRVVTLADYRHSDIKPKALFEKYLELSATEIRRLLLDGGGLTETPCPACGEESHRAAFEKLGMKYVECMSCGTLYVSPRPSAERLALYARESKANEFWSAQVLKATNPARVEHLITPEVSWVANATEEMVETPRIFADVQSRSVEFLEGIDELGLFGTKVLVNPDAAVGSALEGRAGFERIDDDTTRFPAVEADVVTSFYALDQAHDPRTLLASIRGMLVRGGLFFGMGSASSGLDLQVLWDRAQTLVPPENLNVFSVEGATRLLESAGFELVELSTPGHLDIEYIKAAIERDGVGSVPRFLAYVIQRRDENAHRALQEWLQEFRLSSHLRIVARKTD